MKSAYEAALENIENNTIPLPLPKEPDPSTMEILRGLIDELMIKCEYDEEKNKRVRFTEENLEWLTSKVDEYIETNNYHTEILHEIWWWDMFVRDSCKDSEFIRNAFGKAVWKVICKSKKILGDLKSDPNKS